MGPTNVVRARLLTLSGYCIIIAIKTTLFIPCGTAAVPFPLTVMFKGV
jgi:hypothetical protein